jgi:Tol biopolymer transport system component
MRTRALGVIGLAVLAGCGGGGSDTTAHKAAKPAVATGNADLQGKIVYRRFFNPDRSHGALFVMSANGSGDRQITHPPSDAVDSLNGPPAVTPDGAALVFDRSTQNAAGIFRIPITGGREQEIKLPEGVPGDGWPALSRDGKKIAVARAWGHSDDYDDLRTGLYVAAADGTHPRLVADFGYRADVGGATWAPDGRTILFSARNNGPGKPADASALFTVPANGGRLRRLTPWVADGLVTGPVYSPDGQTVLYRLRPLDQDFGGNYWTMRSDGSSRRRLTHFGPAHMTGGATWSPDGSMIVFSDSGVGGNSDLWVMHADGTGIQPLTRTSGWESAPVWIGS